MAGVNRAGRKMSHSARVIKGVDAHGIPHTVGLYDVVPEVWFQVEYTTTAYQNAFSFSPDVWELFRKWQHGAMLEVVDHYNKALSDQTAFRCPMEIVITNGRSTTLKDGQVRWRVPIRLFDEVNWQEQVLSVGVK